jgi:hypothetical protein
MPADVDPFNKPSKEEFTSQLKTSPKKCLSDSPHKSSLALLYLHQQKQSSRPLNVVITPVGIANQLMISDSGKVIPQDKLTHG